MKESKRQIDRWKQFNSIIDNKDLKIKEKGILLILFRYVNKKTNYASPSRTLIKQLTGITDNRTLDNALNALIEKEYISRISGKGIRSKYYLNNDKLNNCDSKKVIDNNKTKHKNRYDDYEFTTDIF